jgi:hypothetical protein
VAQEAQCQFHAQALAVITIVGDTHGGTLITAGDAPFWEQSTKFPTLKFG